MRTNRRPGRDRIVVIMVAAVAALFGQVAASLPAAAGPHSVVRHTGLRPNGRQAAALPHRDAIARPDALLGAGWQRSGDVALAVAGDATGLHVLAADSSHGYQWRTVASLGLRGTDTTQWIGQACLTAGGKRAVVVYAPRQITNTPDALGFGALAAVVKLQSGKVTQLGAGASIAYFNPGCGAGQDAVLTQGGTGASPLRGRQFTRLMVLNTATGKITSVVKVAGQVTSAVPWNGRIAAVYGNHVVSIGTRGSMTNLATVHGQAYRLSPDARGGLGFQVAAGKTTQLERWAAGRVRLIGSAPLGAVELSQVGGQVFVTGGHAGRLGSLPASWRAVNAPSGAQLSSTGKLAVTLATTGLYGKGMSPLAAAPDQPQPVRITAVAAATGKQVSFAVPAAAFPASEAAVPAALPGFLAAARSAAPARGAATHQQVSGISTVNPPPNSAPATTTYDPDRSCSVPRNYVNAQTYQPSAQQIEWAADEAVQNKLTNTQAANLYGSGLPSYTPQGLFPAPGLTGGGTVPAQVLLGVLAQESNLDQASNHAIIGQTGNFMPSFNWYGDGGDYTFVKWSASDCGYGIAQVTTGMCLSGFSGCTGAFPYNNQLAVAIDYEANIAAGLQILEQKWNQLYGLGIKANGGSSKYIENWWFALWAYNSGMQPDAANGNTTGCSPSPTCTDSAGHWGLGWTNNPANPLYPPDRPMFLAQGPAGTNYSYNWDEAHPGNWSYEEKVIGFGAFGFVGYSYIAGAWQQAFAKSAYPSVTGGTGPSQAQPSITEFCSNSGSTSNNCNPANAGTSTACTLSNSHCWWHSSITWIPCATYCGTQVLTYAAGAANPGDPGVPAGYAPPCTSSPLPSGAYIVGNTASSIPKPLGCGTTWSNNGGTIKWTFASDTRTNPLTYPSKIDFHQIGAGYSGHFWFTHTITSDQSTPDVPLSTTPYQSATIKELEVTGTWNAPSAVVGHSEVIWVSVPNEGAWDPEAVYQIYPGGGQAMQYRVVNQAYQSNTWVNLGAFSIQSGAYVALNNVTFLGLGEDIAWGAVAFASGGGGANYVALGDSYSAGQGIQPYDVNSDYSSSGMSDACHRSTTGYPTQIVLPGDTSTVQKLAAQGTDGYANLTCSGETTVGITPAAVDLPPTTYDINQNTDWGSAQLNSNEIPEASQGWLTKDTNLVTITIGGNDARFADVLTGCILPGVGADCTQSTYVLTRHSNGAVDPKPLQQFEPTVITDAQTHLQDVYAEIHTLAPNAEIVVIGYPHLFPPNEPLAWSCTVGLGMTLDSADTNWMNQMGDALNTSIANAVAAEKAKGVNINFVNPVAGFAGHEVCSSSPWINGLINWSSSGSGSQIIGGGSFHPMESGAQEYATLISMCLLATLPKSQGTCSTRYGGPG